MARTGKLRWRGDRVQSARDKKGLTSTFVAAQIGVTSDTLRNWERNETVPDAVQFGVLATLLDVDLNYLVNLTDEPARA